MRIRFSNDLCKQLEKLKKTNRALLSKVQKKLKLFYSNPYHPSLRIHKLTGKLQNIWSISITRNIRMLFLKNEDEVYFFDIGTHDEVYEK